MHFKKRQEQKGVRFYCDQQLNAAAGKVWDQMSQHQKDSYKVTAKSLPSFQNKGRKTYNSVGRDIAEVEAERVKKNQQYENMVEEIKVMISEASENEALDDLVFFLLSTTSFFADSDDVYPAELALAKFSLKEGIIDDIQIRINPGKLPMGSNLTVRENSDKKHKYPPPPNCEGEKDYMTILETMIKFLHPMEKLPIFFALGSPRDDVETLRETWRIVKKIFHEAQEDELKEQLKIYPIDELFFLLQKATVSRKNRLNGTKEAKLLSISFASNAFQSENFIHLTDGCDFHKNKDASYLCCLAKVRSFAYTLAKWCSNPSLYPTLDGKHFPAGCEIKTEKQEAE